MNWESVAPREPTETTGPTGAAACGDMSVVLVVQLLNKHATQHAKQRPLACAVG
jgi:hypothetical protein